MADAVRLLWLDNGALPTFPFVGKYHHLAGGGDDKENPKLRWAQAASHRRVYVPIIECSLEDFLRFMEEPNEVDGDTLYIAIRTFSRMIGIHGSPINSLLLAAAIVPGTIEGAVEHPWHYETLHQISRLCTLNECREEPEDPVLRAAWHTIADHRAQIRAYRDSQDRARKLLESQLDDGQLAEFKKRNRFRVRAPDGFVYLITFGTHGNVFRIAEIITEQGESVKALVNYCIVPDESVNIPIYDQLLGQKLLLEQDPDAFFSIANATEIKDEPQAVDETPALIGAV